MLWCINGRMLLIREDHLVILVNPYPDPGLTAYVTIHGKLIFRIKSRKEINYLSHPIELGSSLIWLFINILVIVWQHLLSLIKVIKTGMEDPAHAASLIQDNFANFMVMLKCSRNGGAGLTHIFHFARLLLNTITFLSISYAFVGCPHSPILFGIKQQLQMSSTSIISAYKATDILNAWCHYHVLLHWRRCML